MALNNTDFVDFLESLGAFESGIDTTKQYSPNDLDWLMVFDPSKGNVDRNTVDLNNPDDLASLQYHVHNTLGFLGKYQFGEPLLIDLGYYTPAPTGFYGTTATNEWQGTWTGKNGVFSKEDFMSQAQETAIREAFAMNMGVIEQRLAQVGTTIDDYLGMEFTYTRFGVQETAEVTMSGILASAHLQGPGGVANLLINNVASSDEYGTNILFYMDKFGGYDTPFGTAADDMLAGSDYTETFQGGLGDNVYETGDGDDQIILANNPNGTDTITDFDINKDVISLKHLNGVTFADLNITDDGNGNAVINLPNDQSIVLNNVNALDVVPSIFVNGPIKMSWNANSGDTVIENFNLRHDSIDLNYAFASNNLAIYEENGAAVIEVVGNNQRLILDGIQLQDLEAFHFIKAPVDFATVFFGTNADNSPPPSTGDNTSNPDNTDNSDDDGTVITSPEGDVYSFTWNWGASPIINDFDPSQDTIDLQGFWTDYGSIAIYNNSAGNAVIDLMAINNQLITLANVSAETLSAENISGVTGNYSDALTTNANDTTDNIDTDPTDTTDNSDNTDNASANVYSYTWQWGSNNEIQHFDLDNDIIDLSAFWTSYAAFSIYDNANGDAVIDLMNLNNQIITVIGVSSADLDASNIAGISGQYTDALTGNSTEDNNQTSNDGNDANNTASDVYSFTWNWGANNVIDNFDVSHDVIDLKSFWTTRANVDVYNNSDGDAVIDLTTLNNQTITLEGVSANDLGNDNIVF